MPEKPVNLCDRHAVPYAFTGAECPMCRFLEEVLREKEKAYKEGFIAGVEAQQKEQELIKEAKDGRSTDNRRKQGRASKPNDLDADRERKE